MMDNQHKVIWCEGMFLQPHHFQQQDRYWQSQVHFSRMLQLWSWGFTRLKLDVAKLQQGIVALSECEGVMPDGTSFSISSSDAPLLTLRIDDAVAEKNVVLALPLPGLHRLDSQTVESRQTLVRYRTVEQNVIDRITPDGEAILMQVGALNLQLADETQVQHSHCFMTVARVKEVRANGCVVLDETYIPPLLHYRCVSPLADKIDHFLARMEGRLRQLQEKRVFPGGESAAGLNCFLFLQSLSRAAAVFSHLSRQEELHPERLFYELCALAGEWRVFTAETRAPLPDYIHQDLARSFTPLLDELQYLLANAVSPNVIELPLQQGEFGIYQAQIADTALLQSATLILAVKADLPASVLRDELPSRIKVGASERIRDLVNLQLPGVLLTPIQTLPHEIPRFGGYQYFTLGEGAGWSGTLHETGGLAIHVAGDFPDGRLALWAYAEEA